MALEAYVNACIDTTYSMDACGCVIAMKDVWKAMGEEERRTKPWSQLETFVENAIVHNEFWSMELTTDECVTAWMKTTTHVDHTLCIPIVFNYPHDSSRCV